MFHSTAALWLSGNGLTGMIPSEIGTMTALSKSSCCFVPCRDDCGLTLMCHFLFFIQVVALQQ